MNKQGNIIKITLTVYICMFSNEGFYICVNCQLNFFWTQMLGFVISCIWTSTQYQVNYLSNCCAQSVRWHKFVPHDVLLAIICAWAAVLCQNSHQNLANMMKWEWLALFLFKPPAITMESWLFNGQYYFQSRPCKI